MTIKDPKIKTKVFHRPHALEYRVIGQTLGTKFKIAVVKYLYSLDENVMDYLQQEAKEHAEFISYCFNNSKRILDYDNNS